MQKVWFTPRRQIAEPAGEVELRPMTGPELLDAQGSGQQIYTAFAAVVSDWKNVPLLGNKFSEEFDREAIFDIVPAFVVACVNEAARLSNLSEDEIKNSGSPST